VGSLYLSNKKGRIQSLMIDPPKPFEPVTPEHDELLYIAFLSALSLLLIQLKGHVRIKELPSALRFLPFNVSQTLIQLR